MFYWNVKKTLAAVVAMASLCVGPQTQLQVAVGCPMLGKVAFVGKFLPMRL